jgi:hypothetical protein
LLCRSTPPDQLLSLPDRIWALFSLLPGAISLQSTSVRWK